MGVHRAPPLRPLTSMPYSSPFAPIRPLAVSPLPILRVCPTLGAFLYLNPALFEHIDGLQSALKRPELEAPKRKDEAPAPDHFADANKMVEPATPIGTAELAPQKKPTL